MLVASHITTALQSIVARNVRPSDTAVLDLRTNTLHRAAEAWAWDLSGDGRALRRVDPLGRDANGKPLPGISCLDVVALTDTLPTGRTGLCADVAGTVQQGLLSPDGTWAVLSTMDSGAHRIYNLGNGSGYSNRQVIDVVRQVTDHPVPVEVAPRRAGDPAALVASSEKARRELGWTPDKPELARMVADSWAFARARH